MSDDHSQQYKKQKNKTFTESLSSLALIFGYLFNLEILLFVSKDSCVAELLLDQAMCVGQRSCLHRFEGRGPWRAVRF